MFHKVSKWSKGIWLAIIGKQKVPTNRKDWSKWDINKVNNNSIS
jgi:hypothetical protein